MPPLKWGLVAVVAVIVLLVAGAFFTGMLTGFNRTANATSASGDKDSGITPAATTKVPTPARTTAPVATTTTVPATTVTANASATKAANALTTVAPNATANVTVNATATPALPVADASHPLPVGGSAYDGKGNLTVNDFSWKDKMSDPIPSYAIGKKYLIVNITYENLQQNGSVDAGLSKLVLKDGGGYPFEPASDGLLEYPWTGTSIGPKEKRTGNLLFIVPPGATFLKLHYTFGDQGSAVFQLT